MEPRRFATTRWSLIAAAGQRTPDARAALEELCRVYWYPLYAFVRRDRRQRSGDDAADLTQGFFTDLLGRDDLAGVGREKGRFRSWLLQSMRHFLANEADRRQALKRGGGLATIHIDGVDAEQRYRYEPVDGVDAEMLFHRRWAMTAIQRAMTTLRAEVAQGSAEKAREFDALKGALLGEPPDGGYEALAASLGTTPGALRTAASRWRKLLREEVAETLALGEDVDAEIEELIRALS
ncbi:MAG: hypothetical protein Q8O67_23830 [Deltaproteobacteria bacterium]|nr:hypothetical protein [Deltaproteobacteria bacterium]